MALNGAHHFNINEAHFTDNSKSGLNGIQYLAQNIASDATHDSGKGDDRGTCHPGTRVDVVDKIVQWANSDDAKKQIYWLHGPAGVGKSVITQTAAVRLEAEGKLGATFFFSRTDPTRNNVTKLFSTIAYKLAISLRSNDLRRAVESHIEHDPSIVHQSMKIQWAKLIVDPFKKTISDGNTLATSVILIDGLDECENDEHQLNVLELLDESNIEGLPLRIIISSRPEAHIRDSILKDKAIKHELHRSSQVDNEIRLFFFDKFSDLTKKNKFRAAIRAVGSSWPSDGDLNTLVTKASGQYIYATTVLRYVELGREGTPVKRLKQIISLEKAHESLSDLDILYREILSKCPSITLSILGFFYIILRGTRHILTPTLSVVDQLLQLEPGELHEALENIHSLVSIPDLSLLSTWGIAEPYFHHASLEDFFTDKRRSGVYFINMTETHEQLRRCCKKSLELIFSDNHVHQHIDGSAEHYTCNLLGCFYALMKYFKRLGNRKNYDYLVNTLHKENDFLSNLKDRVNLLLLNCGKIDDWSKESKRRQLELSCSLEAVQVSISSIGGHFLVMCNLPFLSNIDTSREELISNVLDFAACNPYNAGDVKRELLRYMTSLLVYHQVLPSVYYLRNTSILWQTHSFARGSYAELFRGSLGFQDLCQKRYRLKSYRVGTNIQASPHQIIVLRHVAHCTLLPLYGVEMDNENDNENDNYRTERPIFPFMLTGNASRLSSGDNTDDQLQNNYRLLLISDTIAAIKRLHLEGIIPNEVKPLNILISDNHRGYFSPPMSSSYSMKLYAGKDSNDVLKELKMRLSGSLRYAAPETMSEEMAVINEKANIYSLSLVIYQVLTRREPFYGWVNEIKLMIMIIYEHTIPLFPPTEDPCWASNGGPLTEEIRDLLIECWDRDPNKRPSLDEIYDRMHLGDIEDTRPPDDWPLAARFNDLKYSAQLVTPEAIEDMFAMVKEAMSIEEKMTNDAINRL